MATSALARPFPFCPRGEIRPPDRRPSEAAWLPGSPLRHFICMYYTHRKRIQRFLSSCVPSSCFFMVFDARWGCQDNATKLTGWELVVLLPFFLILEVRIKSEAGRSTLIQPACEAHNFPRSATIGGVEFAN